MFENMLIWKRLAIGFGIIILFTLTIGVVALFNTDKLDTVTHELYERPYKASNAMRDVGRRIFEMQNAVKDTLIYHDESRISEVIEALQYHDVEILNDLAIIKRASVIEDERLASFVASYKEWRSIQADIISHKRAGDDEQLRELISGRSEDIVAYLERYIDDFLEASNRLGDEFIHQAEQTHKITNYEMVALLVITVILGLFISSYIARGIVRPLDHVVKSLKKIAMGDLDHEIAIRRRDELGILADSFRDMISNLRHKSEIANHIKQGDLNHLVDIQSKHDRLALAMNEMIYSLRQKTEEAENQHWLINGQAELAGQMRADQDLKDIGQNVINFLAQYLNCHLGALFIADTEEKQLDYLVGYACSSAMQDSQPIAFGEGLIGQAANERKVLIVDDAPVDYIKVSSSLGDKEPSQIIVLPLVVYQQVFGVIELASFHRMTALERQFINSVAENIAIAISSAQSRVKLKLLLEESQRQAELLQIQQNELQASNAELEEKTEKLLASEEHLKIQQEELQATNEELEEQTATLKASEGRLQTQQEELQAANEELEMKSNSLQKQNERIERYSREISDKASALEQASRYKSEFLANMSHELRTPLNSLLLLARTLSEDTEGNLTEDQIEAATIIYNSGHDLLSLINDILDLSKIEAGQMTLDVTDVRPNDLVSRLRKTFTHVVTEKGLAFNIDFEQALPEFIKTDFKRLDQILKNLISNAIKFTHQGSITIRASLFHDDDKKPWIRIAVIDTGIGIPEEKQALIFEAFKQADGGTARQYGGTGLGLSISRQLAVLMGGKIFIASKEGEGSTFTLDIPADVASVTMSEGAVSAEVNMPVAPHILKPSLEAEVKSATDNDKERKKALLQKCPLDDDRETIKAGDKVILVIEDDLNFAKILLNQARRNNFKAIAVDDGEAGYLLAEKFQPDAVILDISLPGIDGFTVLDRLKENPDTRHIPVHIVSAMDSETDATRKGAIGFLQKPVDKDQLENVFSNVSEVIAKEVKDLLLVEDDESVVVGIRNLIGNGDVKITIAGSGADAFKLIQSGQFDCMILDLGLPDMSGFELLTRLNAAVDIDIPPVIVYTARELSREETDKLREFSQSIIIKGVRSEDRLLDETALFLHRIVGNMPQNKQKIIRNLYEKDAFLLDKKVLIVDDDMRNLFALSKILRDRGMKVFKAQNGRKGLEALEENEGIDLVLMDIMMPEMDGYETTRAIRAQEKYTKLPVIALTAKAMKEDREKCIAAGASDYLSKPVDIDRLLSILRVWLYQ